MIGIATKVDGITIRDIYNNKRLKVDKYGSWTKFAFSS
jgi:hypothetical protein